LVFIAKKAAQKSFGVEVNLLAESASDLGLDDPDLCFQGYRVSWPGSSEERRGIWVEDQRVTLPEWATMARAAWVRGGSG